MKKTIIIALFAFFLIFPLVAAMNIDVYTYKYHKVSVYLLQADGAYYLLDSSTKESDGNGLAAFTFTPTESTVDILINIKIGNEKRASQRFEDIPTSGDKVFEVPEGSKPTTTQTPTEPPINETNQTEQAPQQETEPIPPPTPPTSEENKELNTEEKDEGSSWFTGLNIFKTIQEGNSQNSKGKFGKIIWLIAVGLIIGLAVVLGTKQLAKMKKQPWKRNESFFVKKAEKKNDIKISTDDEETHNVNEMESEIAAAEIKIKEAKMQIAKIKNRDKIKEAESKLEEDRKRLEKLREGYDDDFDDKSSKPSAPSFKV